MSQPKNNTGNHNRGDSNTGHYNTGDCNTGNYNTGYHNTSNCNTGHYNVGDYNTGHYNAGNCNTGNGNTGYHNTENYNAGNCNAGYYNTGNRNTGSRNTGDYNTGNYNRGDYNTGFFCTQDGPVMFFDRPWYGLRSDALSLIPYVELPVGCEWVESDKMTEQEKIDNPNHTTTGGFLRVIEKSIQEAFSEAWAKMDAETRQRFLDLPNFDADKFLACTGVDVRTRSRTITLEDGRTVEISAESYAALSDAAKK